MTAFPIFLQARPRVKWTDSVLTAALDHHFNGSSWHFVKKTMEDYTSKANSSDKKQLTFLSFKISYLQNLKGIDFLNHSIKKVT